MKKSPFQIASKGSVVPKSNQGFTLIELLMVIAIIVILASITFGISRGVYNAQARSGARGDLAAIAQGVEQFKSVFGDYPITEDLAGDDTVDPDDGLQIKKNNKRLVLCMRGEMVWTKNSQGVVDGMEERIASDDYGSEYGGRLFLTEETLNATYEYEDTAQLQDSWGRPYIYDYTSLNGAWDNFGFILCSAGPDGLYKSVDADGILTPEIRNHEDNIDNIYFGE